MRQELFAAVVLVFVAALARADDPKPATPPRPTAVTSAKVVQLEEELETLEAQREVKRAYVKAAEVGVRVAEAEMNRFGKLVANRVVSKEEFEKVQLEVEVAKAQVDIRTAELKEIEVKVKYAKKRLADAK